MAQQGIDYAKLAAEFGGKPASAPPTGAPQTVFKTDTLELTAQPPAVDYAALAAEFGGVPANAEGEMSEDGRLVFRSSAVPATTASPVLSMYDALGDLGIGAAKGAGRSAVGLGRLFAKVPGIKQASEAILPGAFDEGTESALGLDPSNTAQKIGMGVEQAAEFMLPGGAIRRAPAMAAMARRVPTLALGAAEALAGAGVSAVQGGDVSTAAALGAAGPLAGKVVGATAKALRPTADSLRKQARTQIGEALHPTKEWAKAKTARIAPEIQKRGMTGSREDLLAEAVEKADEFGQQIDDMLVAAGQRPVALGDVRRRIASLKGETYEMVPQADGLAKQVIHDPRKFAQIEKLERLIDDYGNSMNVRQATAIRRTWDDVVQRAGGYDQKAKGGAFGMSLDDAGEASVTREGASALRNALAEAVPDVRAINKEYGFWADLRDVLQATQGRTTGQKRGLFRKVMASGGTAAGAVIGSGAGPQGAAGGAVLVGALADRAEKAFSSPQWKLLSAKHKTRLADAIAAADRTRISNELGRIGQLINAMRAAGQVPSPAR